MAMPEVYIQFKVDATVEGLDKAVAIIKYADSLNVASSTTPAPASGNGKAPAAGKAAPKQAAPAPGKKAAPAAAPKQAPKPAAKPAPDPLDLSGGDDDDDNKEDGGLGLGDMFDEPEEFKGTPEDAKEEALGLLRIMLANGHKDSVKKVQQVMKVAKFHDVPPEQGLEFLKRVKEVQAQL